MSRTFKVEKDMYGTGEILFKTTDYTIQPGVTIIIGCNGTGKSTLMRAMTEQLDKVPEAVVVTYNNQHDGDNNSIGKHMFYGDIQWGATAMCSSEGERICMNMGDIAKTCGNARRRKFTEDTKEFWLLLDAVDSGYSVDNVVELKEYLFNTILQDMKGEVDVYIVATANAYELARGEQCLDVRTGKYVKFKDYNEYRDFILLSRANKDKRIAQAEKKSKKSQLEFHREGL